MLAHVNEELCVRGRDCCVVIDDGDHFGDVVDEGLTGGPAGIICEVDADEELGDGDGGDRCVVIVGDHLVEV